MEEYDYRKAVCDDIREYLRDNGIIVTPMNRTGIYNRLNMDLMSDSVTSDNRYTTYQAAENLCHNWDLLQEAASDWCVDLGEWIEKGEKHCDMHIRIYLIPQCLSEVLKDVEIDVSTLDELADYINEADEWPQEVSGIIEANEWEDLTGNDDEVCSDGYEKVVMDNGKAIVREIDKGNDYE